MVREHHDDVDDKDGCDERGQADDADLVLDKVLACGGVVVDAVDELCPEEEGGEVGCEGEEGGEALEHGVHREAPPGLVVEGVSEAEGGEVEDCVDEADQEGEAQEHMEEPFCEEVAAAGLVAQLPQPDADADELEDCEEHDEG